MWKSNHLYLNRKFYYNRRNFINTWSGGIWQYNLCLGQGHLQLAQNRVHTLGHIQLSTDGVLAAASALHNSRSVFLENKAASRIPFPTWGDILRPRSVCGIDTGSFLGKSNYQQAGSQTWQVFSFWIHCLRYDLRRHSYQRDVLSVYSRDVDAILLLAQGNSTFWSIYQSHQNQRT